MSADSAEELIPRFAAGTVIGGYRLERHLGRGGMASVFLAADIVLSRQVALKVLPAEVADQGFRQRFIREPRLAAGVDDPHIIPIHGAGEDDGVLYIAMRYVPGGDARALLRRCGSLSPERAAAIISPVALALDAAHGAGLVHRDVKPANILLDVRPGRPDHVYLADFGISKPASPSVTTLTGTGKFVGTLNYVAPEQIRALALTGTADQYSLACTAYELLTGRPPFASADPMALIAAHLLDPAPAPSARDGRLAAADPVFARALAKDPAARYPSCRDFADDLRSVLGLAPYIATGPQPEPAPDRTPAPDRGPGVVPATKGDARAHPRLAKWAGARTGTGRWILPRRMLVVAVVAVVAIATAGVRVLLELSGQISQASIAQSEAMAAQATGLSATNVPLAMLLSLQAFETAPTVQAGTALAWASGQPLRRVLAVAPGRGSIESVAFSPDGKTLAAGDNTGQVSLWNMATGQRTATLSLGKNNPVCSLAFSPDGETLAAGGFFGGHVMLWITATGQRTATLSLGSTVSLGRDSPVCSLAFSPDGETLAAGGGSGHVRLWNAVTGQLTATLNQNRRSLTFNVAFSPDGKALVAGSGDSFNRYVSLWSMATGQRTATLNRGGIVGNQPGDVAFSPDGKVLAIGDNTGQATLWNTATGQRTATLSTGGFVSYIAFSPDGKTVAAVGGDHGQATLWNTATGQRITTLKQGGAISSVAFSPDGKTLAIGDEAGHVSLWATTADQLTTALSTGGFVSYIAFSPDGKTLAVSDNTGRVTLWNTATGQRIAALNTGSRRSLRHDDVAFSPDGKTLAVGDITGHVSLWATATGQRTATLNLGTWPGDIAFSPDGKILATGGDDTGHVMLWNTATGQRTATLKQGGAISSVAFSPDGKILAVGDYSGHVSLSATATGQRITTLKQGGAISSVAFSPDGKTLATASGMNTHIILWNTTTGQRTATLALPSDGATVAFSRAGILVTGDVQGDISIWNASARRLFATPVEGSFGSPAWAYVLSPDGHLIAAAEQADGITLLRENLGNLSLGHFERLICGEIRGNPTRGEWAQYAHGQLYQKTCPAYP